MVVDFMVVSVQFRVLESEAAGCQCVQIATIQSSRPEGCSYRSEKQPMDYNSNQPATVRDEARSFLRTICETRLRLAYGLQEYVLGSGSKQRDPRYHVAKGEGMLPSALRGRKCGVGEDRFEGMALNGRKKKKRPGAAPFFFLFFYICFLIFGD